jgi:Family of unknown function (DUF5706)
MKQQEAFPGVTAYAERVLAWGREELNRADTKASILLAGSVAVVAAVIAGVIAGGWLPTMLTDWREPLWWTGTAAAIVAILLLAAAIYPRTKRRDGRSSVIAYYGDVVGLTDRTELLIALERSARRDVDRLIDQIYQVSRIVKRKYRLLALGMWSILVSAAGCCLSVLLEVWTA